MGRSPETRGFIERWRRRGRVATLIGVAVTSFALKPHNVNSAHKTSADVVTVLDDGHTNTPKTPEQSKPKYTLDQLLQAIALHESGGNPKAVNPEGGGAHGKYQYETSTWIGEAKIYYPPALDYANADKAPEAVQDALTYLRFLHEFTRLNEDALATATYNYWPKLDTVAYYNHSDPRLNWAPPSNHGLTIKMYDDQIMHYLTSGEATHIPMLKDQAPDFDYWKQQALAKLSPNGRAEIAQLEAVGQ